MRAGAVRIAIEDLLGDLERLGRVFAQRHVTFGDHRRRARAAEHLLEEAPAAAGFSHLGGPQRLAAFKQARLLRQDLIVEINGVIEVVPL